MSPHPTTTIHTTEPRYRHENATKVVQGERKNKFQRKNVMEKFTFLSLDETGIQQKRTNFAFSNCSLPTSTD